MAQVIDFLLREAAATAAYERVYASCSPLKCPLSCNSARAQLSKSVRSLITACFEIIQTPLASRTAAVQRQAESFSGCATALPTKLGLGSQKGTCPNGDAIAILWKAKFMPAWPQVMCIHVQLQALKYLKGPLENLLSSCTY